MSPAPSYATILPQAILRKNNAEGITILDFKIYYKVVLEHSHAHLFCGCFHLTVVGLTQTICLAKPKIYTEKVCPPWSRR